MARSWRKTRPMLDTPGPCLIAVEKPPARHRRAAKAGMLHASGVHLRGEPVLLGQLQT